jgi:biopolymer transport protein ExbD
LCLLPGTVVVVTAPLTNVGVSILIAKADTSTTQGEQVGEILTRTINSVSGNDYDRDDNERRDQRKGAIECFRSGLCDIVGRRHGLRWRM